MADMMQVLQKRLEFAFLGGRFWVFAEIGALLVVLTSFSPYFAPYNLTALVVLACALAWDLWRNAPKSARYGMALTVLAAFVFLLLNTLLLQYAETGFAPPVPHEYIDGVTAAIGLAMAGNTVGALAAMAAAIPYAAVPVITLVAGVIGSLLFLVSGLMGVMAARRV